MVDAELTVIAAQAVISFVKIRAVHVQNAVCNVVALRTAHCEEGTVLQLKRLTAHQVNDVRADLMHVSAVPLFHGIFVQRIEVFVIAVYEQDCKRQGFQPVDLRIVALVAVPDAAKIAADDHVVVFRHVGLLWKILRLESESVSVKVAGCVNHFHRSNRCLISAPPLIRTRISSAERTVTRSTI